MPPTLRLVRPGDRYVVESSREIERAFPLPRWFWLGSASVVFIGVAILVWLGATAETRALRALPDGQRSALYRRTIENLRNLCDPAPPRSMRAFCREQAALAGKFLECDGSPLCRELVSRHLFQPRR